MKNLKINAETSYKTLKTMVPDVSAVHTPKGETLLKSDREVLIRVREDSATTIVYKDGFFAYIDDSGEVTARAVANCHVMRYEKAEGGFELVPEEQFEDLPFPVVLSHFGMVNIEDKRRKEQTRHVNISLDADEVPNDPHLTVPNFADELDLDGEGNIWEKQLVMLPEAMECLTERQREVVVLHYINKMTEESAAKQMGITRRALRTHMDRGLSKLKNYFEKTCSH